MTRIIQAAAAQMGPIAKSETRKDTVRRLTALMRQAKERGAELVVFTEMALTTFFPRWLDRGRGRTRQLLRARNAGA
jgi:N-carbamoyl-D-amino-acid hydrolase